MSICLRVLSLCLWVYFRNYTFALYQFGRPSAALRYGMYFRSCGWHHVWTYGQRWVSRTRRLTQWLDREKHEFDTAAYITDNPPAGSTETESEYECLVFTASLCVGPIPQKATCWLAGHLEAQLTKYIVYPSNNFSLASDVVDLWSYQQGHSIKRFSLWMHKNSICNRPQSVRKILKECLLKVSNLLILCESYSRPNISAFWAQCFISNGIETRILAKMFYFESEQKIPLQTLGVR